jgi:hypothetical protein
MSMIVDLIIVAFGLGALYFTIRAVLIFLAMNGVHSLYDFFWDELTEEQKREITRKMKGKQ